MLPSIFVRLFLLRLISFQDDKITIACFRD
nr:MAG TPA: hypothetical protein [Caudoviricetes sp.]DAM68675.1 MAG TPA: hypothetical protein [Caudoviricetes sp.]DAQ08174.1 MAG TPA: hypothetical protein [Caudoviricetes sp.]DAU97708.1 MAG TPA: hypothetical protein [Bacteriophage sp.]DAY34340.1 MAG TPA: hypothetical protein [Caudoviricetes sp.]